MSEVRFNLGPFSHIVVDIPNLTSEGEVRTVLDVTGDAVVVAKALHDEFEDPTGEQPPERQQEPYVGPDGDPGPQDENPNEAPHVRHAQQEAQQMRERAPQQEQPRYGAGSGVETKEQMLARCWGTCPDCGHDSKPSILKYQKWDTTDDGIEVPGKHYCSNESCPRKGGTIWRRELVPIPPF